MPAKRSHRQASSNKDGVRFIDTVKKVLAESFETNEGGQVFFGDIFDAVSKATPMSAVRENLLHRHSRRLFTEQWTSAGSAMVDSVRCFTGVSLKK
jgi:ribulose kinase